MRRDQCRGKPERFSRPFHAYLQVALCPAFVEGDHGRGFVQAAAGDGAAWHQADADAGARPCGRRPRSS